MNTEDLYPGATELITELISLRGQINSLHETLHEKENILLELVSPYKVGDIVFVHGYRHTDKRCKITDVNLKFGGNMDITISVMAEVLKKDGTRFARESYVHWDSNTKSDSLLRDVINRLKALKTT